VNEAILTVEHVAGGYRQDYDILREANFRVYPGEIVCLIGPNGAGKSTLLKAVCGGLPYVRGSIRFRGEEIVGLKPHDTLHLGICYVPQGRRVFPGMTVKENLEMGAYVLEDQTIIRRRMALVRELFPILNERFLELAYKLSGGEQQMLAIARALMLNPGLLMLDEPSLGLAPKLAALVFDKIKELNDAGTTILLVEQQAKRALRAADRGYVLVLGETRLSDTGQNLLNNEEVRALYIGASAMGDVATSALTP
jgi:ABC-type branched-subunit amino acid transport system ATPase component